MPSSHRFLPLTLLATALGCSTPAGNPDGSDVAPDLTIAGSPDLGPATEDLEVAPDLRGAGSPDLRGADLAPPPSCFNHVQDGDESDEDCGGSCAPCTEGWACRVNADCESERCVNQVCGQPDPCAHVTCNDPPASQCKDASTLT